MKTLGLTALVSFGVVFVPICMIWIMRATDSNSIEHFRKTPESPISVSQVSEPNTPLAPIDSLQQNSGDIPTQPEATPAQASKSSPEETNIVTRSKVLTSESNGYDWNFASESEKRNLCNALASATVNRVSSDLFYDALNESYNTADPHILEVSLRFTCQYIGRYKP